MTYRYSGSNWFVWEGGIFTVILSSICYYKQTASIIALQGSDSKLYICQTHHVTKVTGEIIGVKLFDLYQILCMENLSFSPLDGNSEITKWEMIFISHVIELLDAHDESAGDVLYI